MDNLEKRAEAATTARKRHAEEKTKAVEAEEERHKATMLALEEEFKSADEHEDKIIRDTKEAIEKTQAEYEKQIKRLDGYLAKHVPRQEEAGEQQKEAKGCTFYTSQAHCGFN